MVGATDPLEVTLPMRLVRGVRKACVLLIVCLAFAAVGILMIREGATPGYFVASVFGLGALIAAINLHPRSSYLELGPDGFTVCSLFRRSFVPWHHVEGFVAIRMHSDAMVGWNYTSAFTGSIAARRTSLALAGVEAARPVPAE